MVNKNYIKKIYIISEDVGFENNQTWIIDNFKNEFLKYSNLNFVIRPEESDIIWIISCHNRNEINNLHNIDLKNKIIITTIHHIDFDKLDLFKSSFNSIKNITTKFHVINIKVYNDLKDFTDKPIIIANFWINENIFFDITNKSELKKKYNIDLNSYCVGSFQKDTEGKNKCMKPKLSKGPDILIEILKNIKINNNNLVVILTGRRRNYIINELENNNINYLYYPMVDLVELNELYNCLDLYIVSSRVEGGPRAIIECGINKTPIISTNVGIANSILSKESIYDMNNPISYKKVNHNVEYAYIKSSEYTLQNYLNKFIKNLFLINS